MVIYKSLLQLTNLGVINCWHISSVGSLELKCHGNYITITLESQVYITSIQLNTWK